MVGIRDTKKNLALDQRRAKSLASVHPTQADNARPPAPNVLNRATVANASSLCHVPVPNRTCYVVATQTPTRKPTMKVTRLQYPMFDIHAVDGDTLTAWVQISAEVRQLWRIRIRGVEGGELPTERGLRAKVILENTLRDHSEQTANFIGLETVRDQFGRRVGDVFFANGQILSLMLLKSGAFWRRDRNGTQHLPNSQGESKTVV
jgi:endonuclease YncB( thermonuclease family)